MTPEQKILLYPFVAGAEVHDLGAGDLRQCDDLLSLGVRSIIAVDKRYAHARRVGTPGRIKITGDSFDEYAGRRPRIDIAFVSWPEAYAPQALVDLVAPARLVVYIGSNFDGTVCGSHALWQHLVRRQVLVSVSAPSETLIVYGPIVDHPRRLLPEEYAGIRKDSDPLMYTYGSLDKRKLFYP